MLFCLFVCLFGLFLWCIVQSVIFIAEFQSAVLLQFVLYVYMKYVSVVCAFTNVLLSWQVSSLEFLFYSCVASVLIWLVCEVGKLYHDNGI